AGVLVGGLIGCLIGLFWKVDRDPKTAGGGVPISDWLVIGVVIGVVIIGVVIGSMFIGAGVGWLVGGRGGSAAGSVGGGVGALVGLCVAPWAARTKVKGKEFETEMLAKWDALEKMRDSLLDEIRALRSTAEYGSRYGLDLSNESNAIARLGKVLDRDARNATVSAGKKNPPKDFSELKTINAHLDGIEKDLNQLEQEVKQKVATGEKVYHWLVELDAIRDGQTISQEQFKIANEVYTRWDALRTDRSIDERMVSVEADRNELERIRGIHTHWADCDPSLRAQVDDEVSRLVTNIRAKTEELNQLEASRENQNRYVTEIDDQVRFWLLSGVAGGAPLSGEGAIPWVLPQSRERHLSVVCRVGRTQRRAIHPYRGARRFS
ncbi:MAG: hypothetical protein AB1665_03545, partial [Candidatus Thermoplasmatota archaeon]